MFPDVLIFEEDKTKFLTLVGILRCFRFDGVVLVYNNVASIVSDLSTGKEQMVILSPLSSGIEDTEGLSRRLLFEKSQITNKKGVLVRVANVRGGSWEPQSDLFDMKVYSEGDGSNVVSVIHHFLHTRVH